MCPAQWTVEIISQELEESEQLRRGLALAGHSWSQALPKCVEQLPLHSPAESYSLRGLAASGDHAGKARLPTAGGRDAQHCRADASHGRLLVRAGHGAGTVCRVFTAESSAVSASRADADRDPKSR